MKCRTTMAKQDRRLFAAEHIIVLATIIMILTPTLISLGEKFCIR